MTARTVAPGTLSRSIFAAALLVADAASGQVVRLRAERSVTPQLAGSISLSATPSSINFTLVPGGQATASAPISITSTYNLTLVSGIYLYAFFSSSTALSTAAGDIIPASSVFGLDPNGAHTTFTPFTQTTPFGSNGLVVYQLGSVASFTGTRNDSLFLMINTSAEPQLAAGTYVGTLVLQAQAF